MSTFHSATSRSGRPRGRRPGTSDTRQTILETARAHFAQDGYTGTTLRKIASEAGVDTALIMQYFGSKEDLFAAVMSIPPNVLSRISDAFAGPEHSLGERVARTILEVWEDDPQDFEPLLAMLRGAISNEQANAYLSEFIQTRLAKSGDSDTRDHDATFRIGLASSMLLGVVMSRRIVQVPTLAEKDRESVIAAIAPALQDVLRPQN